MRAFLNCLLVGVALAFAFLLNGCGGESGGTPEPGPQLVQQTFDEKCSFCHASGRAQDVAVVHSVASNSPSGIIDNVIIDMATGLTTVFFRLFDNGAPLAFVPAANIRFTLAKLVPPPTTGDSSFWQNYINTIEQADGVGPGTTNQVQGTYERANTQGGVFTDNQNGSYSYQFSFDIRNVTSPIAVLFDPTLTHRLAMQVSDNVDNAFLDFVPSGGTLMTRDIAKNASCNECHVKLSAHGGERIALQYCVTCHNPGTTDANSGNTVDFKVFIHKLHDGENLPSVQAGGDYAIWGFNEQKVDFSEVVFPQDIRNCVKCHDGTPGATNHTVDGDNWKTVPTIQACGSCHDNVNFATGANHPGGNQANNAQCAGCHPAETGGIQTESFPNGANVTAVHVIPEQEAAKRFQYNIISVTNTAPGQFPMVTFSVTDPTNGNAPYNILTDPEFTAGSASTLNVLIGWPTTDYTNTGSTKTPAQPISISALAGALNNGDGTFTVAPTVAIPADVTGSGVVAMEGHPAVETVPGSGVYNLRVPVTGAVQSFAITDQAPQDRRAVVDIAKCDQCHGLLSLHGSNRNNNPQLCVICHNPNDTDINRRPSDPSTTPDGKREEAIDFKYLIHAIHGAAERQKGIVIYGFNGSPNDFSNVSLPSGVLNIKNCAGCHISNAAGTSGTFQVPINANALPTTILTGADLASPNDDTEITPTASVCSACHDNIGAKTHISEQGGKFDFVPFAAETTPTEGQTQESLCGPGPISAQPAGHTTRTDCCSCHSQK
jgi:OmcA/MtrC family decaheme c-type cytochrome